MYQLVCRGLQSVGIAANVSTGDGAPPPWCSAILLLPLVEELYAVLIGGLPSLGFDLDPAGARTRSVWRIRLQHNGVGKTVADADQLALAAVQGRLP